MSSKKSYSVKEVFGQSRGIPLNYVEREEVDNLFRNSLNSNQHIVIHGSSKQGKTSLRKHILKENDFVLVHCSNKWDIGKLNAQILKQSGFELKVSHESTIEGNAKMTAKLKAPFFEIGGESGLKANETNTFQTINLDIYDVNDIIESLKSVNFNKYILIEDFHYLDEQTQRDFSFQLKAFHEISNFTFIIIGVWLEENKLTLLNGDLSGRIFSINADEWKIDELKQVIIQGEDLLNIHFTHQLKTEIVKHCLGSVFLLQEICKAICEELSFKNTLKRKTKIEEDDVNVFIITKKIILQQRGRYESFLRVFVNGLDDEFKHLYKQILLPIFEANTESLIRGIAFEEIKNTIIEKGKVKHNENQIIDVLNRLAELQRIKNIKPRILDFDNTNFCLNIVDRGFISWLIFQNKDELKNKVLYD